MAEIINIKNEAGEVQYPVTKPECVIDENGKSVLTLIQENGTELRQEIDELSERINNLPQGEEFDKQGNYPLLHVGTADDLAGRGESVPASFGFRASGGKSIKDGRAYIKRIKGNSVVWNQKIKGFASWNLQDGTIEGNEAVWSAESRTGVLNAYSNTFAQHTTHKYLITADVKASSSNVGLGIYYMGSPLVRHTGSGNYESLAIITNGTGDGIDACYLTDMSTSGYGEIRAKNYRCIDLTQMFGAGNEPTTIEEFNARVATLGVDMNAYNEGQVIHCNTESIKSVGDNAWDEQWENGTINVNTGDNIDVEYAQQQIRSKNLIRVLPNEDYYIALPQYLGSDGMWVFFYDEQGRIIEGYNGGSGEVAGNASLIRANDGFMHTASNASYIKFYMVSDYGSPYNHDILISLYHSGWKAQKDDQYQPYWQDTLPLPIIRKYFPDGMKSTGTAHDEIRFNKASGKWEYSKGKIKSVNLSSIIKEETGKDGEFLLTLPTNYAAISSYADIPRLLCSPFITNTVANVNGNNLNDCIYGVDDWLIIRSSRYFTLSDIKAAMAGVILYYESNDWEWEELDEADQNFRDYYNVADFGTEQSQSSVPSAAFSADIIYQFNAVDMIREHELEITELQSIIATMQAQLTSLINGGQ